MMSIELIFGIQVNYREEYILLAMMIRESKQLYTTCITHLPHTCTHRSIHAHDAKKLAFAVCVYIERLENKEMV